MANECLYHIYNRGVNKRTIFTNKRDYQRVLETIKFYLSIEPPVRYSQLFLLARDNRQKLLRETLKQKKLVDIICFCLMPNHFHFLLKQNVNNGISNFMRKFQVSYSRYFNTKHERIGPLLQGSFKAVKVESEEQLLHLSRYIHLNPYSSNIIKDIKDLIKYPWSSLPEYLGISGKICKQESILSLFKDSKDYLNFLINHANHQKELKRIEHLIIER